jgi:hypothetical protein
MQTAIRSIMSLLAAGALLSSARAGEKKPNGLTDQEIRDGWIRLFDGDTLFGWKATGSVDSQGGLLSVGGEKAGSAATTTAFGPGVVRLRYRNLIAGKAAVTWRGETLPLGQTANGSWVTLEWEPGAGGVSPIALSAPAGTRLDVRAIDFKPRGLKPLLNGKDLTGWAVFRDAKRSKSKFAVTRAGELHLTNGPGDLQTINKYDDFVLQLECKTNGKALNSGVFFRCIPNQYQNGYEMQINNGYKNGDRTKPSDGGTGAIYRRVTARKIVANDREWFTMTLIADGPHFATWVNGYQTADWTDTRKPDDNPRKGRRTAAGHLSIQGHDPTTDILFRNIRLGELKK